MSDFIASLDIASFPVVVINKNGNVTGKNKEASDVFGDLRVGESIFNKAKPTESAKIFFFEHHTFKRGYVIDTDDYGDRRIVMFPMIIQNGEFDRELTSKMSASVLENELSLAEQGGKKHKRLYPAIANMLTGNRYFRVGSGSLADAVEVCAYIQNKLGEALLPIGKRVALTIGDSVKEKRQFLINEALFDNVIAIGAFISLSASKNGATSIFVDYDKGENELTVEFSSKIKDFDPSIVGKQDVSKLFPECAAELCITKMLGAPTFDCFIGDGVIRLYSRVPVLDADKALLNSPPVDFVKIADIVFGHLADQLT